MSKKYTFLRTTVLYITFASKYTLYSLNMYKVLQSMTEQIS